ncbi:hypothetical protein B0G93_12123 [Bacillus sp. V-88]|nr:hypothetical protein B1B00_16925 [Bacillus sp. DSM 27956]PRX72860.1 hypothetical protein B0G93_12123 [Bacillus sp. V-88]SLK24211.1 hypothetical protein SAMN06295884_12123 [Bacillus sp. V-88]
MEEQQSSIAYRNLISFTSHELNKINMVFSAAIFPKSFSTKNLWKADKYFIILFIILSISKRETFQIE